MSGEESQQELFPIPAKPLRFLQLSFFFSNPTTFLATWHFFISPGQWGTSCLKLDDPKTPPSRDGAMLDERPHGPVP
jgi:hypothetical protein